uniref:SLC13 family permease n=1 Tax=Thaumasiovibrio occultus TaxID=1891184 RepID=UPI00192CEC1C|nr:SLC13 family permease [Thaumasiovibrio occultus]
MQDGLVLAIFVSTIIGLIAFQNRPALVFGSCLLALNAFGLVTQDQLLNSIANPGLLTLVLLIVCSFALEKTSILRRVAAFMIVPGYRVTWLRLFFSTVFSSAFLNNTAVVATLIAPIRNNNYHNGSRLLIPLSFAAILGGTLTLIGTSTNLIVNSLYIEATTTSLGFFSFTIIGLLLVITCGITMYFSCRFLPDGEMKSDDYKQYFIDAKVDNSSDLIGKTVEQNGLRHLESLFLIEIARDGRLISPVGPTETVEAGDRLIFNGDVNKVMQLSQFNGLTLFADSNGLLSSNLQEVVIRPESQLVGKNLKAAGFRALFNAAVVAIRRDGERVSGKLGDVTLQAGDFLVLAVGRDFANRNNLVKNFINVSDVEPETKLSGWKEWCVIFGFLAVVAAAALGVISLLKGCLLLAGLLIFIGSLTPTEITRRLPIDIWLIVSTALMLSQALTNGELFYQLSDYISSSYLSQNVFAAMVMIYVVTWLLTELVTNNAAAALIFPIAYGMALGLDANVMPFVMAVAFGASASFVSPYGYQTNLMVFNAGQYNLKDFVKVGLPVSLVYGAVTVSAIPVFFPF